MILTFFKKIFISLTFSSLSSSVSYTGKKKPWLKMKLNVSFSNEVNHVYNDIVYSDTAVLMTFLFDLESL